MIICSKCGTENDEKASFCKNCGSKIEQIQEKTEVTVADNTQKTNQEKKNILPLIISAAVVLVAGIIILAPKFSSEKSSQVETEPDDLEIAESVENTEEIVEEETKKDLLDMDYLDSIIASDANGANISVCVADIKNDAIYATNNAEYSMSASALVNLPILYTVAKELESGNCSWNSQVSFQYRFSGRGTIKKEQDGEFFDLDYLVRQMLNYSDNNATNSLIDYFGKEYINNVCRRNSFASVDVQRYLGESAEYKDNYISARDAVEMLAEIYTSTGDDINKNYLISHFNIYDDARYNGIGRNLPEQATFLNHNAVTSSIYNESAIIVSDDAEYIIAVLCNNGQMSTSAETVARISDYVYEALRQ